VFHQQYIAVYTASERPLPNKPLQRTPLCVECDRSYFERRTRSVAFPIHECGAERQVVGQQQNIMVGCSAAQLLPPPAEMERQSYQVLSPRWVGSPMAACSGDLPWQRVINSQEKINDRPGAQRQRQLLTAGC